MDPKIINPYTLNFLRENDRICYLRLIIQNRKAFLWLIFLAFWVVVIGISAFQYETYTDKNNSLILLVLSVVFTLFISCIKHMKNDLAFDIIFTLFISAINIILLEIFIPLYFKRFKDCDIYSDNPLIWMCIFVGIHINTMSEIMNSAKIRWYIVSVSNIVIKIIILRHFVFLYKINSSEGMIITLISSSFLLQILISYLNERKTKESFVDLRQNRKFNENIDFFKEWLENEIHFIIIILNGEKPEILYCNTEAKHFFHVSDQKDLMQMLKEIKLSNEPNTSLMELYQNTLKYYKEFDDVYNNSTYHNIGNKENYLFDLYFKSMLWNNTKITSIILNDITIKNKKDNKGCYNDILLPTVSHNLKTPLNSIAGFLELASEKLKNNVCLEYIEAAQCSCKNLLRLVNDILDVSQLISNTLKLNLECFYILKPVKEILEVFTFQMKKKNLSFECIFLSNIERIQIYADPMRFQQILYNLLSNALKYTFKGKVSFNVNTENSEFNGHTNQILVFKVIDTGIGIATDKLEEIFKIYKKIEYSNKECSGFGLSISQYLAKSFYEEGITVISTLDKGSEFRFSIPIYKERSEINSPSSIEEHPFFNNFPVSEYKKYGFQKYLTNQSTKAELHLNIFERKIIILLVDDDVLNNLIHYKYVENLGFDYEVASNGREALDKILENAKINRFFSTILLDCNMPVLNGFETAREINFLINQHIIPYVPIIAVTANTTINDDEDCKKAGMEFYLSKPVSRFRFKEKIMEALSFLRTNSF